MARLLGWHLVPTDLVDIGLVGRDAHGAIGLVHGGDRRERDVDVLHEDDPLADEDVVGTDLFDGADLVAGLVVDVPTDFHGSSLLHGSAPSSVWKGCPQTR